MDPYSYGCKPELPPICEPPSSPSPFELSGTLRFGLKGYKAHCARGMCVQGLGFGAYARLVTGEGPENTSSVKLARGLTHNMAKRIARSLKALHMAFSHQSRDLEFSL